MRLSDSKRQRYCYKIRAVSEQAQCRRFSTPTSSLLNIVKAENIYPRTKGPVTEEMERGVPIHGRRDRTCLNEMIHAATEEAAGSRTSLESGSMRIFPSRMDRQWE